MADSGILYVLTNRKMPGIVKIGCTAGPVEDRIKQLSAASGVPVRFECHFAAKVDEMTVKENTLHQLFADKRVNPAREFFEVAPEKVVLAITMGPFEDITPARVTGVPVEEEKALEKAVQADVVRSNIKLDSIGITPGTQLILSRGDNVAVTVVEGNRVLYEGKEMSLSKAALCALHKLGYKTTSASGSYYWTYNGETLDDIRRAKEDQEFGGASEQ